MVYLILFLFLLACGGLAALTVLNITTSVHLVVLSWQSPDLPIGIWLLIAFFLGALLLYLVSIVEAWGDRRELKRLRARLASMEKEYDTALATITAATAPRAPSEPVSSPAVPNPVRPQTPSPPPPNPLMPMPGTQGPQGPRSRDLPPQQFRQ